MSAVNYRSQIDTNDRTVTLNAQGAAFLAPIVNTGSNPNLGVIHNHNHYPTSVPIIEVKDRFYGVPAKNRAFVDRPSILTSMEVALSSPSNECRILALKGLGGTGKTQLMLQYCYLHRTAYEYVFWLEVDSWSTVIESFRDLAINLGLDEEEAKGKDSENKLIAWVRSWLQKKTKWLLLLNNADDTMSQDVFKLLPRIGGDIILTTREPISSRIAMVISINKMQQEEALLLLYGVSSMDLIEQDSQKLHYAREIITELDFLPLAIDLARAYISSTHVSFQKYLSLFKDSKKRISLLRYIDEDDSNLYKHTVATVWQLSFEKIRALNPATVRILEACTFLQPEAIPVCLFRRQYSVLELILPSSVDPASEQDSEQSWEFIENAVAVLVKFSFVTRTCQEAGNRDESSVNDLLTIHRLVQKVIYEIMDGEQRIRWAHNLATALNQDAQYDYSAIYDLRTRIILDTYLSHIRHFVTMIDDLSQKPFISKDLSSLLDGVIWYLLQYGRYSGIEELVQFSRLVSEATYGEEDVRIVMSLSNHAAFHRRFGKYVEAEPLLKRALAITEKANGSEDPDTASSLNNLGILYDNWGKYDEAEPLHKRALMIRERALGLGHPDTATSLYSLAGLYFSQGKYDKAEPLYKRALTIREKALGSKHPDTAKSLNNLATLYHNQGKYDEAELLYKQALVIYEKALVSEHPDTAQSLDNLAILYRNRGKYDEAKPLYKRALMIKKKAFGPEHQDIASSLNSLAILYADQGKFDNAERLYKRALVIYAKVLRSEHPDTAQSLNNLAILYRNRGKYDEAEPLYKRALVIREKTLGSEHPDTASSLNSLAILYDNRGKYDDAEPLYKRVLAIRKKALGLEHVDTAWSLNNLAEHYRIQGKYDEAEPLYKRALMIREKALGSEHSDTAHSLNSLASLYFVQGMDGEAEPLYKRALVIREKVLGSEHPDTAHSLNNLARLYFAQGKYDEAEPLFKRALTIYEGIFGSEHCKTVKLRNRLTSVQLEMRRTGIFKKRLTLFKYLKLR